MAIKYSILNKNTHRYSDINTSNIPKIMEMIYVNGQSVNGRIIDEDLIDNCL